MFLRGLGSAGSDRGDATRETRSRNEGGKVGDESDSPPLNTWLFLPSPLFSPHSSLVARHSSLVPDLDLARLPFDSGEQARVGSKDEPERDERPGRVAWQTVVEFGREFAQRGKTRPGYGGEVVMLVVVTDL